MLLDAEKDDYVEEDDDYMITIMTMTIIRDLNSFRNNSMKNIGTTQLSPVY